MNFTRPFALAMALFMMGTAQAAWNRLPSMDARQSDMAEETIPGTELVSSDGIGNAKALISRTLMDDVTLSAGKSSAVLQMHNQQNIRMIAFSNDGAEGTISVTGSGDKKNWSDLGKAVFTADDLVVQVHLTTATEKYITLTFESTKGGTIRSFEIFGTSTDNDFKLVPKGESEGGTSVNLVDMRNSRPIYAFPTPTNIGELSESHNKFSFPKSKDKYRTIVYDLGETRTVKYFATSYSQRPVRVEVFTFEELPEKKDWRGKLTLDPEIFNKLKPTAVGEDPKGVGHIKITPSKTLSVRYVAIRFEPDYQRSVAVSFLDFGVQDLIAAAVGPVGLMFNEFSPQTEARFIVGDDGIFVVRDVEVASSGSFQQVPNGSGNGQGNQQGKKDGENTENNNNIGGGYYPYTSGANGANVGGQGNGGGNQGNGAGNTGPGNQGNGPNTDAGNAGGTKPPKSP